MRSISAARPEPLTARCPTAGKVSLPSRAASTTSNAPHGPLGGSGETASETGRFSAQVELSLRNWPCGQQFRPPESKDSRSASNAPEATDSEAHGVPAGPVFSFEEWLRGEWD